MPKKKKRKTSHKGHVPLHILEDRLHKLQRVVSSRGGKARPHKRRKSSTRKK